MTNVVSLRRQEADAFQPAIPGLIDMFASRRRGRHDAFWLKENAELLQILAALGAGAEVDLEPLRLRAGTLMQELRFFPQYYRMYLSLAVDLRALGMADSPVEEMAAFVQARDLTAVELSDTHRGEAQLLLRRAGVLVEDPALEARLVRFAANSTAFCLPNRRAAYDLTHIVFHASDYGRKPLARDPQRRISLIHAGLVAWLEGNLDLLAEVTLALRLSGEDVPEVWANAVARAADRVEFEPGHAAGPFDDDYHQYLVLNWAFALSGGDAFGGGVPGNARIIRQPLRQGAALHEMSLALLDMGDARQPDWPRMRWRLWAKLSEPARDCLLSVETMPEFEGFFAGFSRAGQGDGDKQ
ncbi:MAG: hypothetical protein U0934_19930 [Pseudotabrizicola sp.]|uniref:DUF6902 family protein n=1 Tax=Pseudotabrizicola sp. TaxID=2939647 RepID=UPI0027305E0D|nr:hypothetical protein [Pseudotabrizicola sp.]MDP2082829.1 hypothetical protein [Pseudotabrizicola sp.]MDZ7576198.1 hypothetical protein [Pseudotabrizicola sp.]